MGDTPGLTRIPSGRVEDYWPHIAPPIQRGADTLGLYNAAYVRPRLESGEWQAWVAGDFEAVCLTEIQKFDKAQVLIIRGLAGDGMDRWLHHLATIEKWGAERGCDRVRIVGRPGWERALKDYRKVQVYMEKPLCAD